MTEQEIFEKVITHLVTQGHRAIDDNGRCRYRAPNGDKCAIGCLIPDDVYQPEMERKTIPILLNSTCLLPVNIRNNWKENYNFLKTLQSFHDSTTTWRNVDIFKYGLSMMSLSTDLDTNFIYDLNWSNFGK